jgi:DegV family protein with EDD domain
MTEAGEAQILNRQNTVVVVDSTADLPQYLVDDPNIRMIPLRVHFGDEIYKDWVDIKPVEFFERLVKADKLPTTSQPSPGEFADLYRVLRKNYDNILSLHLSSRNSGTVESARLAAKMVEGVSVVDTRMVCSANALLADRVLTRLDGGVDKAELERYIEWFIGARGFAFLLDTLDYIYKGGRIGRANHLAGTLLHIKPILTYDAEGVVAPLGKVRGEKKALSFVRNYFLEHTRSGSPVYVGIGHGVAPEKGQKLADLLRSTDREVDVRFVSEVGSVIGTYSGPGALAFYFIQDADFPG